MSKSNENKSILQTKASKCLLGGLLAGVTLTGEIHLKTQCASEGILKGVASKGEFHENAKPAVISRLLCGELWGRALLEQTRITAFDFENPDGCAPKFTSLKKDAPYRG